MFDSIKQALERAVNWLSQGIKRVLIAIKNVRLTREGLGRIGYYAALALLLAILGTASHAYRIRRQAVADAPAEPRQAAIAVQTQSPALMPEPTPVPVRWAWPLEGEIVGAYSPQAPVWSKTLEQWQTHPGIDIAGSPGEAVYACREGTVLDAWNDRLWGNTVVIEHDSGYQSTYAGLNTLQMVGVGDAVEAGQVIGSVGQSAACEAEQGWHLHFELTKNGEPMDFQHIISGDTPEEE